MVSPCLARVLERLDDTRLGTGRRNELSSDGWPGAAAGRRLAEHWRPIAIERDTT
jgi:hypothetical protein